MKKSKRAAASVADGGVAVWDASQRGPVRRYKGHGTGPTKAVRCAACFPQSVAGQMIPLRYGVTIALCEDHRDPAFVHSRGGRDFLAALTTTFESLGLRGARYGKAIQAFVSDVLAMGTPTRDTGQGRTRGRCTAARRRPSGPPAVATTMARR